MFVRPEVLVICPTAAGRMYLGVLLNRIWYHAVLAKTVEEALYHAHRNKFAVIMYDSDASGDAPGRATSVLTTHPLLKGIPLVAFSSAAETAGGELGKRGFTAVLPKPVDFPRTYETLARLTNQPRRQARIPLSMEVEISGHRSEEPFVCTNISEGGMFLRTHAPMDPGSRLQLRFTLPKEQEPVEANAEVVHREPLGATIELQPGMGLRFTGLSDDNLHRLRAFVLRETIGDLRWQ